MEISAALWAIRLGKDFAFALLCVCLFYLQLYLKLICMCFCKVCSVIYYDCMTSVLLCSVHLWNNVAHFIMLVVVLVTFSE